MLLTLSPSTIQCQKKPSCLQQQTEAEQKYQSQHIFAEKSFLDKFGYLPTLLI